MNHPLPARPRWAADARYTQCAEGAYLRSTTEETVISGQEAHRLLDRLVPHLTGERTVAELTAALPGDQRELVHRLLGVLWRRGFVTDARPGLPHGLDTAERSTYAGEIALVGRRRDSAEYRFQQHRDRSLLLTGTTELLPWLVRAALRAGCRHIRVPRPTLAALREHYREHRRDPAQRLSAAGESTPADAVVQLCAAADEAELIALAERCSATGTPLAQALLADGEAWLNPAGAASAWRRLRAAAAPTTDQGAPPPPPGLVATQLLYQHFRQGTGLDLLPGLLRIDGPTLRTSRHRLVPHPADRPAAPGSAVTEVAAAEPVAPRTLLARAAALVDPRTGPLTALDEGDFVQFPLWVCGATVSDPFGLLPVPTPSDPSPQRPPRVTGHGPDRDTARLAALLVGLARYAALAVDRRRLAAGTTALDLHTGRTRTVPTEAAFPALSASTAPTAPTPSPPIGASAGLSWSQAVFDGLSQHCEARLTTMLTGGRHHPPQLDLTRLPVQHLTRQAGAVGTPTAHDLSGLLSVPACAIRLDSDTVLACGRTLTEAATRALERALLAWQSRTSGQPDYAPSTIPPLADTTAFSEARCAPATADDLARALRPHGRAAAVLLDHDPQVTAVLPFLVQIVLTDD
ncbi:hypothetical protein [Streptomyces sp. NPDC000405]|uniref:hypothetical protein n=1 Tax=Streptomyces sp. NPDC000405 TaxID=3161033 RepID=UPI00398C9776